MAKYKYDEYCIIQYNTYIYEGGDTRWRRSRSRLRTSTVRCCASQWFQHVQPISATASCILKNPVSLEVLGWPKSPKSYNQLHHNSTIGILEYFHSRASCANRHRSPAIHVPVLWKSHILPAALSQRLAPGAVDERPARPKSRRQVGQDEAKMSCFNMFQC